MPNALRSGVSTDASGAAEGLALMETAAANALAAVLPGHSFWPLDMAIQWMGALPARGSWSAEAELVRLAGDLAWLDGLLLDEGGVILARMHTSYRLAAQVE